MADPSKWLQSFDAGYFDDKGQWAGGSEIMHLSAHKGKLYAANGYWLDARWVIPPDGQKQSAQVLRLDQANGKWQVDLDLGKCRLSLAGYEDVLTGSARLKVATKYPKSSTKFMNSIGIQPEIIYLNGAQEIAPVLGLSDAIIDLVDTGKTLTANGLTEIKTIADISTRLIANKASIKTKSTIINEILEALK